MKVLPEEKYENKKQNENKKLKQMLINDYVTSNIIYRGRIINISNCYNNNT